MADEETINEITQAAAKADDATLRDILARSPAGTVNMPNRYGRTAIQVMNSMSPSTAQILLDHGADPNVPDPDVQRTILHDIAEKGCLDTLNLLLQHGADAKARDNKGNTPAHLAASIGGDYRIEATTDTSIPDQKVDQNEGSKGAEPGTSSPSPAH